MHLKHAVAISLTRTKIQTISNRYTPEACCGDIVDMKKNPWKKNRHTPEACWRCRWAVWRGWPQETCRCFWGTRRAPRLLLDTCRKAKIKTQGFKKKKSRSSKLRADTPVSGTEGFKKKSRCSKLHSDTPVSGTCRCFWGISVSISRAPRVLYDTCKTKKKNWGTNVTM